MTQTLGQKKNLSKIIGFSKNQHYCHSISLFTRISGPSKKEELQWKPQGPQPALKAQQVQGTTLEECKGVLATACTSGRAVKNDRTFDATLLVGMEVGANPRKANYTMTITELRLVLDALI
jgi:hypothetical protein